MTRPREKLQKLFEKFDRNRSGFLSAQELQSALSDFGLKPYVEEIGSLFNRFDRNHDNKISFHEFLTMAFPERGDSGTVGTRAAGSDRSVQRLTKAIQQACDRRLAATGGTRGYSTRLQNTKKRKRDLLFR